MDNLPNGSFRLFRFRGITVYLHWSWLLVAYFEIFQRVNRYDSVVWNVAEYFTLFGIVLLHEFGHALACRQVGGTADRIMLWPLGGVAYVNPPPRPGALLWSIAAGPLVNVVLVPVTVGLLLAGQVLGLGAQMRDAQRFLLAISLINVSLLVFNILPVYPLDGGQIVRALLWFFMGPARSLMVACIIGLIGGIGLAALALLTGSGWGVILAVFIGWRSVAGFWQGLRLLRLQPGLDHLNRSVTHLQNGDPAQAIGDCTAAIEMLANEPALLAAAHHSRGLAHLMARDYDKAIADQSEAIRLQPDSAPMYLSRAAVLSRMGAHDLAQADLWEAVRADRNSVAALNNLAWLLATCPKAELRDGAKAITLATQACELSSWGVPSCLGTLGAAYAEAGRMAEAIVMQKKALESPQYQQQHGAKAHQRLRLYEAGQPYREEEPGPVELDVVRRMLP